MERRTDGQMDGPTDTASQQGNSRNDGLRSNQRNKVKQEKRYGRWGWVEDSDHPFILYQGQPTPKKLWRGYGATNSWDRQVGSGCFSRKLGCRIPEKWYWARRKSSWEFQVQDGDSVILNKRLKYCRHFADLLLSLLSVFLSHIQGMHQDFFF